MENIKNFPRYERYKDSGVDWIEEIPEHWDLVKLKYLVLEHSGNGFPVELQGNKHSEIAFLKVSDISASSKIISRAENYVSFKMAKDRNWNIVPTGSIVTAKIGEALKKNHRKILGREAIIDNNCIGIESININPEFNYFLHQMIDFNWFVNPGAVPSISVPKYKNLFVAFPPFAEQTAIAQFLDHKTAQIDRAIAIKEEQIKLLNERKQIMIQEAVTKGLDPTVSMKDSGVEWIGEIPEHWEVKKIKFLTSKVGSGITPRGGAVTYLSEGIPLLRSQNIFFNKIEFNNVVHISSFTHNEMKNSQVHFGDVLLNITGGSIGRCYFVDVKKEINVNQHVCIIRPIKSEILTKYLHMLFTSKMGQDQIWSCQQGGGREGLNFNAINNFLFPIPQLDTQKKIMAKLENLNHQTEANIELYHNQIQALKEYKTTLINEAVTGKIKVN